MITGNWKDFF